MAKQGKLVASWKQMQCHRCFFFPATWSLGDVRRSPMEWAWTTKQRKTRPWEKACSWLLRPSWPNDETTLYRNLVEHEGLQRKRSKVRAANTRCRPTRSVHSFSNRIAEKVKQCLSGCVPVDEKYGHNKQERKRKEKEIKKKKEEQKTNTKKDRFEVTMSVEIITFKKLGSFPVYLASFFFSSTPLDEQCSNLSVENPNLKNRSQNSPKRRREKQRLARRKHWNRMQAADRPRPDAPSRTQTIFGKVLYCFVWHLNTLRFKIYHH